VGKAAFGDRMGNSAHGTFHKTYTPLPWTKLEVNPFPLVHFTVQRCPPQKKQYNCSLLREFGSFLEQSKSTMESVYKQDPSCLFTTSTQILSHSENIINVIIYSE
jgi:hypothetical protein